MNLCLFVWLLPFLATGNGGVFNVDLVTVEVPTDKLPTEASSGLKTYSTASDYNPFRLDANDDEKAFLGTTFFQGPRKDCFTMEEIALLRARQGYEMLVPKSYPKHPFSSGMAYMLIRYWNAVNQIVYHMSDPTTERLMEETFYDTLGAYFRYYLMPVAQVSFYAGHVSLNTMEHLGNIRRECLDVLNTDGNGWRMPALMNISEQLADVEIEPARLEIKEASKLADGSNICDQLDLGGLSQEYVQGQMLLPLPQLDPLDSNGYLTNVYLPFRENLVCNFREPRAAKELKRFLGTIQACHSLLEVSPKIYNRKLLEWIQKVVPQHLYDEQFYPGLAGILQIQESVIKTVREESHQDFSGKLGRSIPLWREQDKLDDGTNSYVDEKVYIAATIALTAFFIIVVLILHCGCCFSQKKKEEPLGSADLELGDISMSMSISKPKRSKRDKKITIETPMSPLKVAANDRRYYGQLPRSTSSDDCSTSTLGYQFKQKIMPFRFEIPLERVRKNYKYATLQEDSVSFTARPGKETKKSGRGKEAK